MSHLNRLRFVLLGVGVLGEVSTHALAQVEPKTGNVIFIHPDGTSASTWAAARTVYYGPDGDLHWDRLPELALYRGHMADRISATSNGAATTHAYGVKVAADAYGRTAGGENGRDIVDRDGRSTSIAQQAIRSGLAVGIVQSGTITEPGSGCFLAAVESRRMHDEIASQILKSGATVILGGGEKYFLPEGAIGRHGPGMRHDRRNLIDEAMAAGFTVVRSRAELLGLSADTRKVLGLFAAYHTFHAKPEEDLHAAGLALYSAESPTVAEMMNVALRILERESERFLLVVEEEGTDNFGNHNNAAGMISAMKRADDAIGLARAFLNEHPDTLILTASDSDAGGMQIRGYQIGSEKEVPEKLPARDKNGAPMDGTQGTASEPFWSAPDRNGRRLPFGIVWASKQDLAGGMLVRAEGLNSHYVRGSFDSTQIADLMRTTLFGTPFTHGR